jgi:hypothetical protein
MEDFQNVYAPSASSMMFSKDLFKFFDGWMKKFMNGCMDA